MDLNAAVGILRDANLGGVLREAADMAADALQGTSGQLALVMVVTVPDGAAQDLEAIQQRIVQEMGQRVLVLKPQTYMNLSGESVKLAGGFYKIPPERVLVISDDVALPLGKLRIRAGGSAGGHNGLKNIIAHLGTDQFPRIRVGVGAPAHPEHEMIDWVIGHFTSQEKKTVEEAVDRAVDAALCLMSQGVQEAQNRYN